MVGFYIFNDAFLKFRTCTHHYGRNICDDAGLTEFEKNVDEGTQGDDAYKNIARKKYFRVYMY